VDFKFTPEPHDQEGVNIPCALILVE
jgi:hypothetical protein